MIFSKEQLRDIFRHPFNAQTWNDILLDYFKATEIRQTPQIFQIDGINDIGYYLGRTTTEGLVLGFFQFDIKSGNVLRKRVGLRNLLKPFLQYDVDAVIAVFVDRQNWRMSFVSDFAGTQTAPKRFTYVFGDSTQMYNTPVNRLFDLQSKDISIKNLYDTFSVEALSKDFFEQYKSMYEMFCDYIYSHRHNPECFGSEFTQWPEKYIRDYVKKLMGRLVFLQFLQKKGWMGDNANYLRRLFKDYPNKNDFLDKVLEPLFFGVLNTKPADRPAHFKAEGWDLSLLDEWKNIPFLSGGLFEQDKLDAPVSRFPESYFKNLFDFFAAYNFTIDENDPNDAEVGVDPEMLGKIFENLLEDNKDKGAFYTPKEIVRYMSCESVIQYLKTHTDESLHSDIEELVNHNILGDSLRQMNHAKLVGKLLRDVKVCDPAIGSGAFPMGVLNVIFNCRRTLLEEMTTETFDDRFVQVKKEIIQNNIYGVDIEQGAVDIARLRFWLALLVDAKEPEALPNLDYKIMRGNSLIPTFGGKYINLDDQQSHKNMDIIREKKKLLKECQNQFYGIVGEEKMKLEIRIKCLILDIIAAQIGFELRSWEQNNVTTGDLFRQQSWTELKARLPIEKRAILDKGEAIRRRLNDETLDLEKRASTDLDFFDWKIMFSDVFDQNEGFDIVIGNPPYINIANLKDDNNRKLYQEKYKTVKNKSDLYSIFTERAYHLLRNDGDCCYIFSNSWMGTDSFTPFRHFLVDKTKICKLVDLPDKVFKNATVKTCILLFSKRQVINQDISLIKFDGNSFMNLHKVLTYDNIKKFEHYPFSLDRSIELDKINHVKLKDIASFTLGIKTSDDKRFISSQPFFKDSYKLIRGRCIQRYNNPISKEWIWYRPDLFMEKVGAGPRKLEYFTMPQKIIIQDVAQEICATIDENQYLCNDTINVIYKLKQEYSFKYVLGILNSKAVRFWHKKIFPEGLHIKKYQLEVIPIPQIVEDDEKPTIITSLVDKILAAKKSDPNTDTSSLERQIDDLVYELYGLTEEEIAIVEGRQ